MIEEQIITHQHYISHIFLNFPSTATTWLNKYRIKLHANMSYKQGIMEVITDLKDRNGSSLIAIKKAVQEKLPRGKKWLNATFLQALRSGVASGDLVQIKVS